MDILLMLAVAGGLFYGIVRLVRFLVPQDQKARKHEALRRGERSKINEAFERLVEDLRRKPDD